MKQNISVVNKLNFNEDCHVITNQMYKKESCDEKKQTEKDEIRRGLFGMQRRTGLVRVEVIPKSAIKSPSHSPFTTPRPTFWTLRSPLSNLRSPFVACVVWLHKVASMIRECRLDGVWPVIAVLALMVARVGGSEFPERECCDPVYPQNTVTTAAAPVTPPLQTSIKLTGELRLVYLFSTFTVVGFDYTAFFVAKAIIFR